MKRMHACETIEAVNVIFTDKTGTLTQNQMQVVDREGESMELMELVGALNSSANWSDGGVALLGNPTGVLCCVVWAMSAVENCALNTHRGGSHFRVNINIWL